MAVNRRQQRLYFSAPAIFFQLNLRPADLTRSTLRCCLHLVQLHPVLYHSKSSKDHPKNYLKIHALEIDTDGNEATETKKTTKWEKQYGTDDIFKSKILMQWNLVKKTSRQRAGREQ